MMTSEKQLSPSPVRILLVDDDEEDYILTRELLLDIPDSRFDLDWEPGYERAIELICADRFDLILVDYRLGKKDGLELIRECYRRSCQTAMILLTGHGERKIDVAAMEVGASDYLEKSRLDSAVLERAIRYTLLQKRHAAELERRVAERTEELAALNRSLQVEVAERRRVEAALREADHRKDDFLATLAHELRNPLAPIVNSLAIIEIAGSNPALIPTALDTIRRQVQTLVHLIDDLLDVCRISRGTIQLRLQRVTVETVIQSAVECALPLIRKKEHQFTLELPPEPVWLNADPTRLAQVATNLLNNAARYTEPGGAIHLFAEVRDHSLSIAVRDSGVGLSPEAQRSIFDKFVQIDHGQAGAVGGMGIGLWLVDNLVRLHRGHVEVESQGLGHGSTFRVVIPLDAERSRPDSDGQSAPR